MGNDPEPVPPMVGANVVRSQHAPLRIVPERGQVAENPAEFNDVVKSLAALSKGALELEKFQEHVRTQKEAIARELKQANDTGGITPDTMQRIERELKLL